MRPSKEDHNARQFDLTIRQARRSVAFVQKQYRTGMPGAYIDDIGADECTRTLPLIKKAIKKLGIPYRLCLSGPCILIDFED